MNFFQEQTQNFIQELKGGANNIMVAVRIRPLLAKEKLVSSNLTVKTLNDKLVVLIDPGNLLKPDDVLRKNRNKQQRYAFDFAFSSQTTQETVYKKTTEFLIQGVLSGFSATVFAYGATGCGKTFTMMGNGIQQGIMQKAASELFNLIKDQSSNYRLKGSYLQIYNEVVRDLVVEEDKIQLRQDPKHGVVIAGVSQHLLVSKQSLMQLIFQGNRNRIRQATGANQASSRSHAVLLLSLQKNQKNILTHTKFTLVDLAGSERAAQTTNSGLRMLEGAKINRSLLVLGNCISALSQISRGKKINHIPYRGSKLTRLLKDSLSGNCRTIMIANISPFAAMFQDTYNTLNYANRAKSIKTSVARTVLDAQSHLDSYILLINQLKQQNEDLKSRLKMHEESRQIQSSMASHEDQEEMLVNSIQKEVRVQTDTIMKSLQKVYRIKQRILKLQEQGRTSLQGLEERELLQRQQSGLQQQREKQGEKLKRKEQEVRKLRKQINRNFIKSKLRQSQLQIEKEELLLKENILHLQNQRKDRLILQLSRQVQHSKALQNNIVLLGSALVKRKNEKSMLQKRQHSMQQQFRAETSASNELKKREKRLRSINRR